MRITRYDRERDYPNMKDSWEHYGWVAPPPDSLPRIGLVARTHQGNDFVAYMGLYVEAEGGNLAIIEWPVRNPDMDKDLVDCALTKLFKQLERIAESKGCLYLYSYTKNEKWGEKLAKRGMTRSEVGVTTYIKPINDCDGIDFMIDDGGE